MPAKSFKLNNGVEIPSVGLGTWQSPPGAVTTAVYHALKSGYRHIDGALVYRNEEEVGQGLKKAFDEGICKREDVFVTTKLWNTYHRRVEEGIAASLKNLGLDYVDLYLMHWPIAKNQNGNDPLFPTLPDGKRDIDWERKHWETWADMEKLANSDKVKAIGVCNYSVKYLEELLQRASIVPAINQIEQHPYLPQQDVEDYCKSKGIIITSYSPLGSTGSPLFEEETVKKIAEKNGVSEGTVLISYAVARGNVVIPKSVTPARIEANLKLIDLDQNDVQMLTDITKSKGVTRFVFPPFGVNFGFPDKE